VGGLGGVQGGLQGQQGYGNTAGGAGGVGFGSPTAQRSSFQQRLQSIVNRASSPGGGDIVVLGQTKIIADERTNSLLVFATKGDIETITNIIAKLDVVLAQVLIEAIIMEVSLDNTLNYGISYLQSNPQGNNYFSGIGAINNGQFFRQNAFTAAGTNVASGLPSGFSYAARFGNDFEAAATAIATDNRINVLSRPRIQTSHAVEANLFVGETRPYITGTYSYFGGGGPSSQYSQLQIGITLSVLPLINQDGLVVMDIRQKIQSIGGTTKIDNNDIPITIDREANAKVAVQDGQTVILGGFISNDRTKSASGVPLLKDIPILGNLFRSTSKELHRKELMVLIRPTVLPTPQAAALVAKQEKAKLPGISAAERENNRLERRQQKKLSAEDASEQKKLDDEERRELQKKLETEQKMLQKNGNKQDLYKREGFSN
jgi:general secretion pathway protein D